ncbi:MAG: hypothetical protein QOE01_428 [Actinomycetota bacterium]|nr:hypothetical protein [Actinomycetota bacterium]
MNRAPLRLLSLSAVVAVALPLAVFAPGAATARVLSVRTVAHRASAAVNGEVVLGLPSPATDVAAYWRGAPSARVTLSFSPDGVHFGPAVAAGRDDVGAGRHDGRTYGALHGAGGAIAVRVRADRPIARLTVLGLADGSREQRTRVGQAVASASVAQPTVIPRSGWGADESLRYDATGNEIFPEVFQTTKKLIVHHTDTANNDPDPAATVRSIYYYHAVTQGWGDIGYNFLIDESGRIYEGRHSREYAAGVSPSGDDANGHGVTGAHTSGWNSGTVGVALLGTLTNQDATPAARQALTDLLAWEASRNGIDPTATSTFVNPVSGASITTANIGGHRDYGATECPGGIFYATLPTLRTAVAAEIAGPSPSPSPTPTTTSTGPPADTSAPTVPQGLVATAKKRGAALSWSASTDNVAVSGYAVLRSSTGAAGSYVQTATSRTTAYTDGTLTSGRTYYYEVAAYDVAGNRSAPSKVVTVKAR